MPENVDAFPVNGQIKNAIEVLHTFWHKASRFSDELDCGRAEESLFKKAKDKINLTNF